MRHIILFISAGIFYPALAWAMPLPIHDALATKTQTQIHQALHAIKTGNLPSLRSLAEGGLDLYTKWGPAHFPESNNSPLEWAARFGQVPVAEWLLGGYTDPALRRSHASQALLKAAKMARIEVIPTLLPFADVNYRRARSTPLTWALAKRKPTMARMLLDAGANPHGVDRNIVPESPFALAVRLNNPDGMVPLIERGAAEFTPALFAMLARISNISKQDAVFAALGWTVMHWTVALGIDSRRLIAVGSPLDTRDSYGNTPLILAAYKEDGPVMDNLLTHGANYLLRNAIGDSAYTLSRDKPVLLSVMAKHHALPRTSYRIPNELVSLALGFVG